MAFKFYFHALLLLTMCLVVMVIDERVVKGQTIMHSEQDNMANDVISNRDNKNTDPVTETQDENQDNTMKGYQFNKKNNTSLISQKSPTTRKRFKNKLKWGQNSGEGFNRKYLDRTLEKNSDRKYCSLNKNGINGEIHDENDPIYPCKNRRWNVKLSNQFNCSVCVCHNVSNINIVAKCLNISKIKDINADLRNDVYRMRIFNSQLSSFKVEDFYKYKQLNSIEITHNRIGYIENSTVLNQMTVINFDLSFNSIKFIQDRSFKDMSELVSINLSHNRLKQISRFTFEGMDKLQILNLSSNYIRILQSGSFDHFHCLRILDISINPKIGNQKSFSWSIFSNLKSLNELYIQGNYNKCENFPAKMISQLTNLTTLSIDGIDRCKLGPEMKNLTQLVSLYIGDRQTKCCTLKHISKSFFKNVPNLETFRITSCPLEHVNKNAYQNVRNLTKLELMFLTSQYDIFRAFKNLEGLQNSSLKSLRLIGLNHYHRSYEILTGNCSKYLKSIELEEIDLSHNNIIYIYSKFFQGLPRTLTKFVMHRNKLSEPYALVDKLSFLDKLVVVDLGACIDQTSSDDYFDLYRHGNDERESITETPENVMDESEKNQDFQTVNSRTVRSLKSENNLGIYNKSFDLLFIHRNFSNDVIPSSDYVRNLSNNVGVSSENHDPSLKSDITRTAVDIKAIVPPNLQKLLAHTYPGINVTAVLKRFSESKTNRLEEIDFSYCSLSTLENTTVIPKSVRNASFDGNYFKMFPKQLFQSNNSLKYLSLKNNLLGDKFAENETNFQELGNLHFLDISMNMVYDLPPDFFKGLTSLRSLIMYGNKIQNLNIQFAFTPSLKYLDLSKNSLCIISKTSRDDLDLIANSHPLYIDVSRNPLPCTCEGLEILTWMQTSAIIFVSADYRRCTLEDGSYQDVGNIDERVISLKRYCAGKAITIVMCAASLIVIITLITFGLMYTFRWKLRYIRSIALSKCFGFKTRIITSSVYKFDAYILYSDISRDFVLRECRRELEVKRGRKLCLDDRDFLPGSYVVSAIVNAIQSSRKTLVIVTRDFYNEEYSEYAVKMAIMEEIHTKRNVLHLCVCQSISDDKISKCQDLLMVLKRNHYIEFPPKNLVSDEIRQTFWDQLSQAIGPTVNEELQTSVDLTEDVRDGQPGPVF